MKFCKFSFFIGCFHSFYYFAVIFVVCAITGSLATDYCDPNICKIYTGPRRFEIRPHIACPGVAVDNCPDDAVPISMDMETQAVILKKHNKYRNIIAGGKVRGFEQAAAMYEMTWDRELASLAAKNAMQCLFEHDQCRNTENNSFIGQNIGTVHGDIYQDRRKCIEKIVEQWGSVYENPGFDYSLIKKYKNRLVKHEVLFETNNKQFSINSSLGVGYFAQLISDFTHKVGCAGVNYDTNHYFFVCNYDFSPIVGEPVYREGQVTSWCLRGRNRKFTNLCEKEQR